MSNNWISDGTYTSAKPWQNIRCNTLSFGDSIGQLKTQAFIPIASISMGSITNQSPFFYTSDHTSLRIKGFLNITTDAVSHSNFLLDFNIPGELVSRFGTGSLVVFNSNVCEYSTNTNTNNGQVAYGEINGTNNGITAHIFWNNGPVTTAFPARIYIDCCLFKM